MIKNILIVFLIAISVTGSLIAQTIEHADAIAWKGLSKTIDPSGGIMEYMSFDGAFTDETTNLPMYSHVIPLENSGSEFQVDLFETIFETCSAEEILYLSGLNFKQPEIEVVTSVVVKRKAAFGVISFIPIRKNAETGSFEKLVSFSATMTIGPAIAPENNKDLNYAENSVLRSGVWKKIRVSESGIYKMDYDDLMNYGLDPTTINPRTIKLYGNAGGMLPEKNGIFRHDDLQENAIFVSGEEDESFDQGDYILFFGLSPNTWDNVLGFFTYRINLYDDYNYYYFTFSGDDGLRIQLQPSSSLNSTITRDYYNHYDVVEDDEINLILSGKKWYGDVFGTTNIRNYNFSVPNLKQGSEAIVKVEVANRTYVNEKMTVIINDVYFDSLTLTSVNPNSTKFAQKKKKTMHFNNASGEELNVRLEYIPATFSSTAWLDYIMINSINNLTFYKGQFLFRDLSSVLEGAVTQFEITGANQEAKVWDITNPILPKNMELDFTGNEASFSIPTDSLHEFVAFDGSLFFEPEFVETVENQDLHSEGPFDYIIVTNSIFKEQAHQLAEIHDSLDGFRIKVITLQEIYNEFSSGKQDPSAIRDYVRMFYEKFEGQEPRFLLLFGDGSFDPKDRIDNNTNMIPTFQTEESLFTSSSYVVDDYFGFLDPNEGEDAIGDLDIGIGRFPVHTTDDAEIVLDKIKRYLTTSDPYFGNWRNKIFIIADDEDGNLHLDQADSLVSDYGSIPKGYNLKKIYLDTYSQVRTPSGYRYPEVTTEINNAVNNGALIINYVGHGGTGGWASERILQTTDILNWKNSNKLPVFITATCEFSRFDEPELETGGELVLLNPEGGGIALLTTTRLAYAQTNFTINQRVYATAFSKINDDFPYLGDIIHRSKPPGQLSTRNFVLLGDPALRMAYPNNIVRTVSITNQFTDQVTDTLRALDLMKINGEITDVNDVVLSDFNGFVEVTIYDKKTKYKTRGNDTYSYPVDFYCQDKITWQGKVTASQGKFECSFVVPKDIALNYGTGKISYYACSDETDAAGYSIDLIIGGMSTDAPSDMTGPAINLFLNDTTFISGDQTHSNPLMIAFISDPSGINLSAGGIGHEITAIIDDDYSNEITLNDYFVHDVDNYQAGTINYPFHELPDGTHTLTLKAWDNYNNSAEATIVFIITSHGPLEMTQVYNYPNPFGEYTTFTFNHTRPGDKLEINLEIYDVTGNLLQTYVNTITAELSSTPFFVWNGDDLNGNKLKSGMYFYRLKVKDSDGNISVQQQKLLIIN